jgi:hypothetical protein
VKGYTPGSKAHYSCDYGYQLDGDEYNTCEYGKWVGKTPVCKRKTARRCSYPEVPEHGSVTVKGWGKNRQAHYICTRGYTLHGEEYRRCVDGKWAGEMPICKRNYW